MSNFRPVDRHTAYLFPPSVDEWLPEDHLARFEREQADYQARLSARKERQKKSGKKPGGRPPKPPTPGPKAEEQINLTDEDSRIMPVSGGGFEQAYNAQAAVDTGSMLVVVPAVTQACNDKEQIEPMLARLATLPESLGKADKLLGDTGYFSADNVRACETAGIDPHLAVKRERHHQPPVERMTHKLRTKEGRAAYALRKQTVEPVFGIIKSVLGFRQFSLRGVKGVTGEWSLVCLAWNLKRMAVLRLQ